MAQNANQMVSIDRHTAEGVDRRSRISRVPIELCDFHCYSYKEEDPCSAAR